MVRFLAVRLSSKCPDTSSGHTDDAIHLGADFVTAHGGRKLLLAWLACSRRIWRPAIPLEVLRQVMCCQAEQRNEFPGRHRKDGHLQIPQIIRRRVSWRVLHWMTAGPLLTCFHMGPHRSDPRCGSSGRNLPDCLIRPRFTEQLPGRQGCNHPPALQFADCDPQLGSLEDRAKSLFVWPHSGLQAHLRSTSMSQ